MKGNYNGKLQTPINSGFNATSTVHDVMKGIDLSGKTAIVTGGYAGIGLETVKALVGAGVQMVVPARDINKAIENLKALNNVTIEAMDLMDPESINHFSKKFLSTHQVLHILVNNAGIMWVPFQKDNRGNESQLSTNHLGH